MQARRRAGLSSFPGPPPAGSTCPRSGLRSRGEAGYSLLQLLQALHLVVLQTTKLLAPTVIRHLADTDRADRIGGALPLRGQNINLPQLRDDLFRLVNLPRHLGPPSSKKHSSRWTTSTGDDQCERRANANAAAGGVRFVILGAPAKVMVRFL